MPYVAVIGNGAVMEGVQIVIAKTLEVADTLNLNKLQGVAWCEAIDDSNST